MTAPSGGGPVPDDVSLPSTPDLIGHLREFIARGLVHLTAEDTFDPPKVARAVVDLTRCLRELATMETKLKPGQEGSDGSTDATLDTRSTFELAEIVALQVERLHDRSGAGSALGSADAADPRSAGGPVGPSGA